MRHVPLDLPHYVCPFFQLFHFHTGEAFKIRDGNDHEVGQNRRLGDAHHPDDAQRPLLRPERPLLRLRRATLEGAQGAQARRLAPRLRRVAQEVPLARRTPGAALLQPALRRR